MRPILMALALAWMNAPQTTIWGGDHVEMEVTASDARLEFDCAHGTIDEPLRADSKGAFQAKGTLTPERSGPSRDGASRTAKVTYSGTIAGDAMTLRIGADGQDPQGTTYELTRDRRGNVRKCR